MKKKLGIKMQYSDITNHVLYADYFERLKNIAVNIIKWENLPNTISSRIIELTLFDRGYICYFNDEYLGNLCLPCVLNGEFDIYGIPSKRQVYSYNNSYNRMVDETNSILIFNNSLIRPTYFTVHLYACKLANIENAINTNINASKTPILIQCSKEQELTLRNIYQQYQGNSPVIFGDETLNIDNICVLQTNAPINYPTLQEHKIKVYNECLNYLGIPTDNVKRERLTSNESIIGMTEIEIEHNIFLSERKKACDLINKMFGTNISVSINMDIFSAIRQEVINQNEQIYNIN